MDFLDAEALAAGLATVRQAPAEVGRLELIVCRPAANERRILDEGRLTLADGLVGDEWRIRGSRSTADGSSDPQRQLTVMSARVIDLLSRGDRAAWALAGDQLFVDLDLSTSNLPTGARLAIGNAVIEVSTPPHTGCVKFSARFGAEALRLVSTPEGQAMRLRGLNARVVVPGVARQGDPVRRL